MILFNRFELGLGDFLAYPKPIKIVGVVFLSLFIMGIGYDLFVKKNREQYHLLSTEEVILKRQFEQKQHEASPLEAYRVQLKILDQHLAQRLLQWPSQQELPGILDDLSKTATASGLSVELFAPTLEVRHDFYIELPIQMTLSGQYPQLFKFLSRLTQMKRMVTCHDLVIERALSEKAPYQPGDRLKVHLIAKIYRYPIQ